MFLTVGIIASRVSHYYDGSVDAALKIAPSFFFVLLPVGGRQTHSRDQTQSFVSTERVVNVPSSFAAALSLGSGCARLLPISLLTCGMSRAAVFSWRSTSAHICTFSVWLACRHLLLPPHRASTHSLSTSTHPFSLRPDWSAPSLMFARNQSNSDTCERSNVGFFWTGLWACQAGFTDNRGNLGFICVWGLWGVRTVLNKQSQSRCWKSRSEGKGWIPVISQMTGWWCHGRSPADKVYFFLKYPTWNS